jgi:hypothetical protein
VCWVGLQVFFEEGCNLPVKMDAWSLIDEMMALASVPMDFVLDAGIFEGSRHLVRVANVMVPVVGAVSEQDGRPDLVSMVGR